MSELRIGGLRWPETPEEIKRRGRAFRDRIFGAYLMMAIIAIMVGGVSEGAPEWVTPSMVGWMTATVIIFAGFGIMTISLIRQTSRAKEAAIQVAEARAERIAICFPEEQSKEETA
jgi:hypothetical protein